MSLFHFVPWRRLHDDGGEFMAGKTKACRSKQMARGMVKKKPLELQKNAIPEPTA